MKIPPRIFVALLSFAVVAQAHAMRWYSPNTGRWLSRDPIEEDGGANLHAFVANTPIDKIDSFGMNEVVVSGGCNANSHGWDIQGPIDTGFELPARAARGAGISVAHDRNWQNFISAAEAEILRRKNKLNAGERIEWFVEINSYSARAMADGAPKFSYIQTIRALASKHGVILRWFGTKQGFASNMNTNPNNQTREGLDKISRFTYFGHGTKGQLDFHYYDAVQPGNASQSLTRDDIKNGVLLKSAFMNNAIGISCGCNSATKADDAKGSLSDVWKSYFGFELYGANSRIDYANPQHPIPSPGGHWLPSAPPGNVP